MLLIIRLYIYTLNLLIRAYIYLFGSIIGLEKMQDEKDIKIFIFYHYI